MKKNFLTIKKWILRKCHIVYITSFLFSFTVFGQERPNILWITIEDTSPQFIGCYGNEDASTPVIDRLAKEGIRFPNAFSTGTVCSPSRSMIITGLYLGHIGFLRQLFELVLALCPAVFIGCGDKGLTL